MYCDWLAAAFFSVGCANFFLRKASITLRLEAFLTTCVTPFPGTVRPPATPLWKNSFVLIARVAQVEPPLSQCTAQ